MADSEKLISEGGGSSLPQSRSVTAHPDVLKTLGWVKEHLGDAVIVESGKTSTGWWRKWSDGFIEQGGIFYVEKGNSSSISLYTPFVGTDYSVVSTVISNNKASSVLSVKVAPDGRKTNSCGVLVTYATSTSGYSDNLNISWFASGY